MQISCTILHIAKSFHMHIAYFLMVKYAADRNPTDTIRLEHN